MLLRFLERRAAAGAGSALGNGLGDWPVWVEEEKGSDGEAEKQKSCDESSSGGLSTSDYGSKFFLGLAHGNLVNN